jgi:RHS repeat-associated protein
VQDSTSSSSDVPYGFAGHEEDSELGLINMRGRMYDLQLGQFLTPDPIVAQPYGAGLSRYAYVNNSALNFVDPSGFQGEGIGDYYRENPKALLNNPAPIGLSMAAIGACVAYCGTVGASMGGAIADGASAGAAAGGGLAGVGQALGPAAAGTSYIMQLAPSAIGSGPNHTGVYANRGGQADATPKRSTSSGVGSDVAVERGRSVQEGPFPHESPSADRPVPGEAPNLGARGLARRPEEGTGVQLRARSCVFLPRSLSLK